MPIYTGHGNLDVNYNIGDTDLGTTVKAKDLGIKISADTKVFRAVWYCRVVKLLG